MNICEAAKERSTVNFKIERLRNEYKISISFEKLCLIMIAGLVIFCLVETNALKTWIPNTDINNKLNWDKQDTPKNCDHVLLPVENDITTFWNIKDLVLSGLTLPIEGDVIFPHNIKIQFRDRQKCPESRDIKFVRNDVKGWLDPNNWKSDSESQWVPHSERVPCAGEKIYFPPAKTFAIQLPRILVPTGEINFDNEVFRGESWSDFLKTDLGFQMFKGPDDLRSLPWHTDAGCFDKKKCICGRSSYSIINGLYKETHPRLFEEAVCLYAAPKCKPADCYFPVVPEGHCCGICGAVIKLEDKTEEGLNIDDLKKRIEAERESNGFEDDLKTYVGRTKDGNIQVVIVPENSDDTIKSHILANLIRRKLIDQQVKARISWNTSGLKLSNYFFNSASGVVFGTLFAVLTVFVFIFYVYTILPKKKYPKLGMDKSFMFARFDNVLNEAGSEENLEIGIEPGVAEEQPQAFDNPMYSENLGAENTKNIPESDFDQKLTEKKDTSDHKTTKEYSNLVYESLEKSEKLDIFQTEPDEKNEEFSEVEL